MVLPPVGISDAAQLAERIVMRERRALAQAVTLTESTRPEHREVSDELLRLLDFQGGKTERIGISGAPGVGKSTFIETLGLSLVQEERQLAVLTVDPSSTLSGGSILGDKTRMAELSRHPNAFIRPSPAGKSLGGVARRTREVIALCEAAGFDLVIVETVGVGQSEVAVANMTDTFVLLLLPLGGDELQGIKRGIMELADIVLVNKADGAQREAAQRTVAEYHSALRLLRSPTLHWTTVVDSCSALHGSGIKNVWKHVIDHQAHIRDQGLFETRRTAQALQWFWDEISEGLVDYLHSIPQAQAQIRQMEILIRQGEKFPPIAARELFARFLPTFPVDY